ncbi:carbohydrate-binding family 9-like protein [Arenibacter sp. GZD96]|uniref:carbohydrate-binding family 9-like protein n=1 Tax=Aurantibrevibacter litoralis TaxID=3106030 RepID=UPI002AFDF0E0|nr:carbohydrate-binding family 9-like protein [Arenibacter sp. GZD-96]MEA1784805.1 carbohydrate-binding family 9-like protein [Arenibacter sp. GZD-96]
MWRIPSLVVLVAFIFSISMGCDSAHKAERTLRVKEIKHQGNPTLEEVKVLLEKNTDLHAIDQINWDSFPYQPEVRFRIGHHNDQIWLTFYVNEAHVLAQRTMTNSATHKDSCVEFFVDPLQDGNYYNFEFNAIGVTHLAYGSSRKDRVFVAPKIIESEIKTASSLGTAPFVERSGNMYWEMTIVIPASAFTQTQGLSLKGLHAKANFYKCGDETSKPHYLSWHPVGTDKPDFHQPLFFGDLFFE